MSEAPVRRRAARGRGAELRGEVLAAAMELLSETGDESAVSVRAVAQRVGVSVPSIYLHFADKQALLDAVCGEVFEALHQRMRAAAEGAIDPFEALRAQGNAYVRFARENPEHYRLVMLQPHDPPAEAVDPVVADGRLRLPRRVGARVPRDRRAGRRSRRDGARAVGRRARRRRAARRQAVLPLAGRRRVRRPHDLHGRAGASRRRRG